MSAIPYIAQHRTQVALSVGNLLFTLAYAVDSYQAHTSEMLIAINVGKHAVSFGLGFSVLDWVTYVLSYVLEHPTPYSFW